MRVNRVEEYPSDEDLTLIRNWKMKHVTGLMDFVESLWSYADWGWKQKGRHYSISTGGWSGNESLIEALKKNQIFWAVCWYSSTRGGHYEFELPI